MLVILSRCFTHMHFIQNGNTALMEASENGHTAVVKALVDNGAGIEKQNKVCALRNARPLGILLAIRVSCISMPNQEGHTALYKASYHGQRGVVETLLNVKANMNGLNKVGTQILHLM